MIRRAVVVLLCGAALVAVLNLSTADAQEAYGRQWGRTYSTQDWNRFYHYPYVYYPQNFWASDYYRSAEDLYYRYPPEMRVPVYNRSWHNFYPEGFKELSYPKGLRYHSGHHFHLDVF